MITSTVQIKLCLYRIFPTISPPPSRVVQCLHNTTHYHMALVQWYWLPDLSSKIVSYNCDKLPPSCVFTQLLAYISDNWKMGIFYFTKWYILRAWCNFFLSISGVSKHAYFRLWNKLPVNAQLPRNTSCWKNMLTFWFYQVLFWEGTPVAKICIKPSRYKTIWKIKSSPRIEEWGLFK